MNGTSNALVADDSSDSDSDTSEEETKKTLHPKNVKTKELAASKISKLNIKPVKFVAASTSTPTNKAIRSSDSNDAKSKPTVAKLIGICICFNEILENCSVPKKNGIFQNINWT